MQIIIISPNNTSHRHWQLSPQTLFMTLGLGALLLVAGVFFLYQQLSQSHLSVSPLDMTAVSTSIMLPVDQHDDTDMQDYYAKRLGSLQAESIRLTALTAKLAEIVGMDTSEFLLDSIPAQGGIDREGKALSSTLFNHDLTQLTQRFDEQSQQLATIQDLYLTREGITSAIPQGRPIINGYLSSAYGYRIDPFNGKKTFHSGLDFAGKRGSNVIAVANGMVSFIGKRNGYGNLVEIDHGNGYITRYAHNEKIIVKKGDRIKKGQALALMGSTGRSTGPHVHFEVLRDGKKLDPYKFVKR